MHSHDQNMLTKLGFADPDKKLPLHDLACQYLGEPENANLLIDHVAAPIIRGKICGERKWSSDGFDFVVKDRSCEDFCHSVSSLERAISKGEGQYRTTVGFLDLGISFSYTIVSKGEKRKINSKAKPKPFTEKDNHNTAGIAVEVKITPVPIAQILRQINLYREYDAGVFAAIHVGNRHPIIWVCATDFDVPERDVATLSEARIHHVRLGPRFREWASAVDTTTKSKSTVEI